MRFLRSNLLPLLITSVVLLGLEVSALPKANPLSCDVKLSTVKSSQPLKGDDFVGSAVSANPLRPKIEFEPRSSALHMDGGNTNTMDFPGPLGQNLSITAIDYGLQIFYWDSEETMYAVYGGPCDDNEFTMAIAVVNPDTLGFEALWQLPAKYSKTQLNTAYMQVLMETGQILLSSMEGQIYVLQKTQKSNGSRSIKLQRFIDLDPTGVLKGNILLNTVMDAAGNIWFTTGAVNGIGDAEPTKDTVVGYVEPDDTIHSLESLNQSIGQGVAVTNTTIIINTEPSGQAAHGNAVGFLTALRPGSGKSVHVVWNATYDSGSSEKSGAFGTRGSGTTPTLLGNDFVAICDNADVQINLLVYSQNSTGEDVKPICKVPLFEPHASWTDNGVMGHFDGKDYGVVVQNMDQEHAYTIPSKHNINGPYNDLSTQSPGITKIIVAGDGSGCRTEWTNPGRMTTVPVLSTATGLIYGYAQSQELAAKDDYVWYATAIDYSSGETVWKSRTGAGGTFNNNFKTTFLSPNGTLYQMVTGGVIAIQDGE